MEAMHTRPLGTTRSYELVWKGTTPTVRESNWAPGYTPAHFETVDEAVKFGMHKLNNELADMREKWVKMMALIAAMAEQDLDQGIAKEDPHQHEQVDHGGFEDH